MEIKEAQQLALAQMNGIDLDGEIEQKIAKNARRQYTHDSNGVLFRLSEGSAQADASPMRVSSWTGS